ncbi:lytic polysaccharide monooxygenase auxiliary activity family 9 protein [Virgisporangium aurantiacum]|uniref:Chitin-binding protein n=1 Tax=Virgisporangium aurantiacum TaxID=175570 RepID=A0A8J4DX32_9ACTN|nr:lytic polysaccharide monooxygenase [Virgisporangium aurantiacum]GIJ53111.1 chitin-binding protein [Virgisporangium aurantiacum]
MKATGRQRFVLPAIIALAAALLTVTPGPASAHGTTIDAPSRNYGCWARWGNQFQNPAMQTQDPMCWQAWQTDTNAMWNWNGLYRENVQGNHQAAIPNGQLCSAGRTGDGRYRAMDNIGNWQAKNVSRSFTVQLLDQAGHGADYIRLYVTRQGFNPLTQALGWSNLELLAQVGYTPSAQWTRVTTPFNGFQMNIPVTANGRTGRHMVYAVWQASHMDQSFYFCSDVNFV